MSSMKKGFYTALGTPFDSDGSVLTDSLADHIENQIAAGASGLLLMGTMGMIGCVRQDQYERTVRAAEEAVNGRVRLMVGAADNTLHQVQAKLDVLKSYQVSPVLTAPFYGTIREKLIVPFFTRCAAMTDQEIFLYDHPFTAKVNLSLSHITELAKVKNIRGVKTGNIILARAILDSPEISGEFTPILSNSDLFAVGYAYGIHHYLDGIFACFPAAVKRVQDAFNRDDHGSARRHLNEMMDLRDYMIAVGLRPAFTYALNLLGFPGNFGPDYEETLSEDLKESVKEKFQALGELQEGM